ncbi:hypothetical protein RJT34_25083 [Clitoria ternatea]|uniref:Uncharacterized protein n=1 Tax=Clitoria ternatea TaxID=43366 RepID=A0AAN9FRX1_CLITE
MFTSKINDESLYFSDRFSSSIASSAISVSLPYQCPSPFISIFLLPSIFKTPSFSPKLPSFVSLLPSIFETASLSLKLPPSLSQSLSSSFYPSLKLPPSLSLKLSPSILSASKAPSKLPLILPAIVLSPTTPPSRVPYLYYFFFPTGKD